MKSGTIFLYGIFADTRQRRVVLRVFLSISPSTPLRLLRVFTIREHFTRKFELDHKLFPILVSAPNRIGYGAYAGLAAKGVNR